MLKSNVQKNMTKYKYLASEDNFMEGLLEKLKCHNYDG